MSSKPLGRGGKWVSNRVQNVAPAAAPVATPVHAAGDHGFEDSAVNERAQRNHQGAVVDETQGSLVFDRQTTTDALSNMYLFRDDDRDEWATFEAQKPHKVVPSTIDFKKEILSKIKPVK